MFLGRETLNPNNENYLLKTKGHKLWCVIPPPLQKPTWFSQIMYHSWPHNTAPRVKFHFHFCKKGFPFSETLFQSLFQNFQWWSHKKMPEPKMSSTVFQKNICCFWWIWGFGIWKTRACDNRTPCHEIQRL